MEIEKNKKYLVCLLDVMGQSRLFDKISNLDNKRTYYPETFSKEDEAELERLFAKAEKASNHIKLLKNWIYNEINAIKNKEILEVLLKYLQERLNQDFSAIDESAKQWLYNEICSIKLEHEQFSDTIIIYVEVVENPKFPLRFMLTTSSLYFILSKLMIYSFAEGICMRGAIDFGLGWKLEENNFYGPVLATVHNQESKKAHHPRIVLSDQLVSVIAYYEKQMKQLASDFISRFFLRSHRDVDGLYVLDYLSSDMAKNYQNMHEFFSREEVLRAYDFVQDSMLTYIGAKNPKEREQKLGLYFSLLHSYFLSKIMFNKEEWNMEISYDPNIPKYSIKDLSQSTRQVGDV